MHRSVTGYSVADDYRYRGRERHFELGDRRSGSRVQVERIDRKLARLDEVVIPNEMNLPGSGLHPLTGGLARDRMVRVSGNRRIVFRFNSDAKDVDLIDGH